MAGVSKQKFGYQQTLLHGQYKRDLGSFARYQAKRLKKKSESLEPPKIKKQSRIWLYLDLLDIVRDKVFKKIGEDWIFLTILGLLVACLSFVVDFFVDKLQDVKFWLYEELKFSVWLQYVAWTSYSLVLVFFGVGFTHIVAPQAMGSGVPEMKTILRGVVLKECLTFKTLVTKVVGLTFALGSTIPFGKAGPFVHVSCLVATQLSKCFTSFRGIFENESRRTEMLSAACAVGVACVFSAPIGGVLFSIEVTSSFFAVRNYWRGFYSAVCGALMFRLLDIWFKDAETITAVFKTTLRTDFPFDTVELIAFAFMGVASGLLGVLFIVSHRNFIKFTRQHKKLSQFLQKNRFIYPGMFGLIITTLTFPPGFGQYFGGMLTSKNAIKEFFGNITWTSGQAENLDEELVLSHWDHPDTNIYITLLLWFVMNFMITAVSITFPLPCGLFVPVFTLGAGLGRLVGESMAALFPEGIGSDGITRKIVPGGYAAVGAAAFSGCVTRTISTAMIVFEVTGQISHTLPAVVAVLIANAVANSLQQPSIYDSLIVLKRLPYLPDIRSSRANTWKLFVEDFMIKDIKFLPFDATYNDLNNLLLNTLHRTFPITNNSTSMFLLGSIQRYELERMLLIHLSHDTEVTVGELSSLNGHGDGKGGGGMVGGGLNMQMSHPTPPPVVITSDEQLDIPYADADHAESSGNRFQVTRVSESEMPAEDSGTPSPLQSPTSPTILSPTEIVASLAKSPSMSSLTSSLPDSTNAEDKYNTVHVSLRSILKKPSPVSKLRRSSSTGDLKGEVNQFYRQLARERKESRIEDRPFKITSARSSNASLGKKVKLPPGSRKVKHLTVEQQEEWENRRLAMPIEWEGVQIDPAPFQLVERTSLHKVHSLFSLLGLNRAYVTNTGRLVGVVGLSELRTAIQGELDNQTAEKSRRVKNHEPKESKINIDNEEEENDAPIDVERLEFITKSGQGEDPVRLRDVHRRSPESPA